MLTGTQALLQVLLVLKILFQPVCFEAFSIIQIFQLLPVLLNS